MREGSKCALSRVRVSVCVCVCVCAVLQNTSFDIVPFIERCTHDLFKKAERRFKNVVHHTRSRPCSLRTSRRLDGRRAHLVSLARRGRLRLRRAGRPPRRARQTTRRVTFGYRVAIFSLFYTRIKRSQRGSTLLRFRDTIDRECSGKPE